MIDSHHVEPLRAALAGEVILPADAAYEECRKVFNAMHDKRPAVIARCRSTADVVAAVGFARNAMWQAQADDERLIAATRTFCEAMRPFSTGAEYLNFTTEDRVRDAYGAGKYQRLVALKGRYDPGNLFRLNANIRPSLAAGAPALA